jgi:hypothetical protein
MRIFLAAAALAASILTMAPPSPAVAQTAGEQFAGSLATPIDSRTGWVGEPVRLTNVYSESGSVTGATMYGQVTRVVHAGQGRPGQIQMTFTRLVLRSGAQYAVNGVVTGAQAVTKTNAVKEAGGALGGMAVGNILGKVIFHTVGGVAGFIGAAGGYLLAKNNRQDVAISRGAGVRVVLRSVRRQSRRY